MSSTAGARADPAIRLQDLHYAYPGPSAGQLPPWALAGVDLTVEAGERVAIMGPTGSGKTTLALTLLGIVPQSTGGRIRGRVRVLGMDPRTTPVPTLARRVGLVLQDPESQFLMTTVEAEVAFGLESLGVPTHEMPARIQQALDQVNLAGYEVRSPAELSGGQKQRVALAAILAMSPEVLILDEPTARLDAPGARQLQAALDGLQRSSASTLLVISNDSQWVAGYADRLLVLVAGRVVADGHPKDILANAERLASWGLAQPAALALADQLRRAGLPADFHDLETALSHLSQWLPPAPAGSA